jgi:hypothetical protein
MASITLTTISNGSTADATVVNTNFTTIASAINGGLEDINIKAAANISVSKLSLTLPVATNRQEETTNSTPTSQKFVAGYKSVQRSSGNNIVSGTVTFPITFQTTPLVTTGYMGSASAASAPTTTVADGSRCTEVFGISTTGFSFRIYTASGTNWSDSTQYEYISWIALA